MEDVVNWVGLVVAGGAGARVYRRYKTFCPTRETWDVPSTPRVSILREEVVGRPTQYLQPLDVAVDHHLPLVVQERSEIGREVQESQEQPL